MKITATKLFPSGALELCALVSGSLVSRRYFGYTRREAFAMFRAYCAEELRESAPLVSIHDPRFPRMAHLANLS